MPVCQLSLYVRGLFSVHEDGEQEKFFLFIYNTYLEAVFL